MLRLKSRFAEDSTELAQIRVVRKVRRFSATLSIGPGQRSNPLDPPV
jgi:hypothetical protein